MIPSCRKSALRLKLRVIPVLINDAKMPSHEEIPEDLREITWLNAVELRHSRFDDDFRFLVSVVCPDAGPQSRQSFVDGKNIAQGRGRIRVGATGAILGLAAGLLLLMISFQVTGRAASEWIGNDGAVLLLPLFAVLGASAGLFLVHRRASH
jgi:hypothetical protein